MQQDDVVWQIINNQFCSFKIKTPSSTFCRNEYNVTGLCNRQSCPLANSQYATVREHNGRLYLCKKVVERAHLPSKMWEKILLSQNVEEAKAQIEKHLEYWSNFMIGKCQMRVERIVEVQKRMRKLENSPNQPILLPKKSKKVKRDRNRENRALEVSRLETVIEKELVDRLQQGVYGEIYNFNQRAFEGLIKEQGGQAQELEEESEEEYQRLLDEMDEDAFVEALSDEEEFEEELEEELEGELDGELEGEFDSEDEEMMKDLEDLIQTNKPATKNVSSGLGGAPRKRDRRHVEIEYENESLPKRLLQK